MSDLTISVQLLHPDARLPHRAHYDDAGADLMSVEECEIAPGERALVGTGIAIEVPRGYAAFVHPRSGLAAKQGLTVLNAPGTIDSGYRGEVKVIVHNTDPHATAHIGVGDRIAQLVIQEVALPRFTAADRLSDSERAAGGFGSTGIAGKDTN
ncbi:deoxyuridine 5'-triphosphate nucleotidohydrolase [Bowdeniella nasicola]|uniref:dUTP diphosphatase n=1 Tax=Bowdeniella nasicola TaxID=208480 RepID=A0A1Q5Q4Y5_9ACTO|nr:dUTP diphosphatase [Bowdeniella nasicola]OKL54884.1 deoxyuridine 5'-triphosphate nucleotidohydrolase [Bowdeniella nasicola]